LNNFIIKKRYIFFILPVVIIIVILSVAFYSESNPFYIIIDPGHGGRDGGASAADGTLEKDLNLAVALNLRDFFRSAGYNTVMTRDTDTDTDGNDNNFNKSRDILNRVSYTQKYPNSIYISVHMNSSDSSQNKGFQVFYGWKNKKSKDLGQFIYDIINKADIVNRLRKLKRSPDTVYILRNVSVPAVLVECGFVLNNEDLVLLKDEEYQKTMAFVLFCGIAEYLNS
jgi:N-acetylmuramoyl-L-alanine amidase